MPLKEERCSLKTYLNEEMVNSRGSAHCSYYMGMIQLQKNLSRGAGSIYCYQRGLELKIPDSHKSFPILLTRLGGIFPPPRTQMKNLFICHARRIFPALMQHLSTAVLPQTSALLKSTLASQAPQCSADTTFCPKPWQLL